MGRGILWMLDSPDAQPPLEPQPPEIDGPSATAAGIPAIVKAMAVTLHQMGPGRTLRTLAAMNQADGFDCPGCAWPDPGEASPAEFCENGAKAVASEATRARATPEFFARHSIAELASQTDMWLDRAGRLTHPMLLDEGATHYRPVSWDEAYELIAEELVSLPSPDSATFYTSGRTSNEAAFLYQLFVRMLGTNNLPDCSNMCHESSGRALGQTIGVGKGTVHLEDFELADSIWIIGQNPGTNHPRMLSTLQAAARRGCQIVSVNPLREPGMVRFKNPQEISGFVGAGTPIASLFVPVRIGGDVAFFKGVMKAMLEAEARDGGVLDKAFIDGRTSGFAAFRADIEAATWDRIVEGAGVPEALIHEAAGIATASRRMICCWAMGITQHVEAIANIQSIVNLLLLGGHIGRPGAGPCPVRGHSNVQGDRTMGISEAMPAAFLDALSREFGFEPPRRNGLDAVESIHAMHDGRVRVFFAMGGNFLSATPDTEYTAAGLRRCSLTAHVSTKLNRSHLVTGRRAMILPCLGRTERDIQTSGEQVVTVEDSMSCVHRSRGVLEPASAHLKSEVAIVCGVARAVEGLRGRNTDLWDGFESDYRRIRERIARVVPGFEDFEARIQVPGGFSLPNAARAGRFEVSGGRALFTVHPIPEHTLKPGQLLLTTIRSHDQFNTTIYDLNDRYRGVRGGRRIIFMNAADIAERGFAPGQLVDITSHHASGERRALAFRVISYDIPRGCAAAYFPEANVLVPAAHVARGSNQPASKSVVISVAAS